MAARMVVVIYAHPYPLRSRACAKLLEAIGDLPSLQVRALYDLYPDFDIDIDAERAALAQASAVVWLHPVYWYSVPSLMKHWIDTVLARGWAYGTGGTALAGKDCLWVATAGGDEEDAQAADGHTYEDFVRFTPVVEQVARYCGMRWLDPCTLEGAAIGSDAALAEAAAALRARVLALASPPTA
jgi:glutathione-regulated potassium-efflux system ancillary protein KefF